VTTINRTSRPARSTAARDRRRRTFTLALTTAALTLWLAAATPAAQTPPTTPPAGAPVTQAGQTTGAPARHVDAGAAIYRKVGCFQCHVNEAQGGANGPKLGRPRTRPHERVDVGHVLRRQSLLRIGRHVAGRLSYVRRETSERHRPLRGTRPTYHPRTPHSRTVARIIAPSCPSRPVVASGHTK